MRASYEKILKPLQIEETKNDFPAATEQNFIFRTEAGLACAKISSFFGRRALILTHTIPPSDFSARDKEKQYPFSENPTGKKRVFLHKNSLGLPRNRFYLLKHII